MTTTNDKEFTDGIKLVHWVINRRITRDEHRDHENVRSEALVLAWTEYPKLRVRFPDRPIPKVLALAARFGSWRARRGMKLVRTRERGYVDALDGGKALGAVDRPDSGPKIGQLPWKTAHGSNRCSIWCRRSIGDSAGY